MNVVIVGAVLLAGLGLACVATAPAAARLLAWAVTLAFAVVALDPQAVAFRERRAPTTATTLGGADAAAQRTMALAAAAGAEPRARDLVLQWSAPLDARLANGPLGATAALPLAALALQPDAVQVRSLRTAAAGRPVLLQIEAPTLPEPTAAVLTVFHGDAEVLRERLLLGAPQQAPIACTPAATGVHRVELAFLAGAHRVVCRGELEVAEAPRVLVLEPSGAAAAALRAQGAAVFESTTLPDDWRQYQALVIAQALPQKDQQAIVASVIDGMGAFVLAPGFGELEAPLRAVLPVRPLPTAPNEEGIGAGSPAPPSVDPIVKPPPPPDAVSPEGAPRGDTQGAAPVSGQPIEVDKRAIAMVLLVDRSGSMGNTLPNGHTKMSYAKTAAQRTALALGEGDQVGIVSFGNKNAGVVELQLTPATDLGAVRAGIAALAHAPERTFLLAGLRAASDLLASSNAAVKHVVVVTDGEFDTSESMALRSLAHRMRTQGKVTVSMISIVDRFTSPEFGREAELLTRDGGGQFLPIDDATAVPVLVSAEVTRALRRVGREPRDSDPARDSPREPAQPPPKPPEPKPAEPPLSDPPRDVPPPEQRIAVRAVVASALLEPVPDPNWPTLGRAVAGTAPLDAQVLLVAGDEGWPLLAFGNRGLGRVGAFAADLCGPAGAEFRTEPAFPARLALWVQSVLPAEVQRSPKALLREWVVSPLAPTPRDVAALSALAGSAPVVLDRPGPAEQPAVERTVRAAAPAWALVLLLALIVLALGERYFGLLALRRGTTS